MCAEEMLPQRCESGCAPVQLSRRGVRRRRPAAFSACTGRRTALASSRSALTATRWQGNDQEAHVVVAALRKLFAGAGVCMFGAHSWKTFLLDGQVTLSDYVRQALRDQCSEAGMETFVTKVGLCA